MKTNLTAFSQIAFAAAALSAVAGSNVMASADYSAKQLFGSQILPAALKSKVYGGYTRGCIAGAKALPVDGPNWQSMRLSRNMRWGDPELVRVIDELSNKAASIGWNGLLVGDMSQPRGGPSKGHRSHQIGLDVDIWFTPMPKKRMTYKEREETSAISVLKAGTFFVDDARWSAKYTNLLKSAAKIPEVERLLVHPGIKKKLCETVKGDRSWLAKVRPYWGHFYHFHMRIGCPSGSPGCKSQNPAPKVDGCDKTLAWWFKTGLVPKKKVVSKKPKKKKAKKRRQVMLSDMPRACETVINAPSRDLVSATYKINAAGFSAPRLDMPRLNARKVLTGSRAKKVEKTKNIPIPVPKPKN